MKVKETHSLSLLDIEEVTLIAGAATFENPFAGGEVLSVQITEKGAAASGDTFAADWLTDPNEIAISSDNAGNTSVLTVATYGRY